LCVFLYLGLWLKFSINVVKQFQINIINEGSNFFYETNVHLLKLALKNNFEDVLIKIIFGLLTILITIILFKKIFDIDFKKKFRINNTNNFEIFFKKKTFLILTIYFSFIFLLILLNGIFDIVHLGKKINFEYKDKIFKFIFILLIPLSLCFILDIIKKRKKFYNIFFLLSIFLLIIAATTLYSRSAILTLTPLLIVYFLIYKNKINLNFLFYSTVVIFILFLSFDLTNKVRANNKNYFDIKYKIAVKKIKTLMIQRWVGISGMINVEYTTNKSFKKFKNFLNDKNYLNDYYQRNFYYSSDPSSENYSEKKIYKNAKIITVYVPGFMAFFNIPGSVKFFILANSFFIIFLLLLELGVSILLKNFYNFIAMFAFISTWRAIHLGLFPINSVLFYLSMISVILIIIFLNKLINYFTVNEFPKD